MVKNSPFVAVAEGVIASERLKVLVAVEPFAALKPVAEGVIARAIET